MAPNPQRVALSIAGSDPSGGAGIQADLKTFHQHGVYGMSVLTLLTVQNTQAVAAVNPLAADDVIAQLDAVLTDILPQAIKTGALGACAIIEAVADAVQDLGIPLIVDPVMISTQGAPLLAPDAVAAMRDRLLPAATLVTPNTHEAAALTGLQVRDREGMAAAATILAQSSGASVLVKGGHLDAGAADLLLHDGDTHVIEGERHDTPHTHGTGCVLSAAITARLARGEGLVDAVRAAKHFVNRAIGSNPGLGHGNGPVNLFAEI